MKHYKISVLNILFILIVTISCNDKKNSNKGDEYINITAEIPENVKTGDTDTLKFYITSKEPIFSIEMRENDTTVYIYLSQKFIGEEIYDYNADFLYKPVFPGNMNYSLYVIDENYNNKSYPFTILVTP